MAQIYGASPKHLRNGISMLEKLKYLIYLLDMW